LIVDSLLHRRDFVIAPVFDRGPERRIAMRPQTVRWPCGLVRVGMPVEIRRRISTLRIWMLIVVGLAIAVHVAAIEQVFAQAPLSAEEARTIEFGKDVFKLKGNCQQCHKWDAGGDTGYGGVALSLRKTQLTPEQMIEVIKCGRPFTGMPFHDQYAYSDKRCYGMSGADLGKDTPPIGESLHPREIAAVVKYLYAKAVGRGASTYEDCVDFWGTETRQCDAMKK
jgi:mono/diheme cytochrome c family protein